MKVNDPTGNLIAQYWGVVKRSSTVVIMYLFGFRVLSKRNNTVIHDNRIDTLAYSISQ